MAKKPTKGTWGGVRPNSGPKSRPSTERPQLRAETKVKALVPAEPKQQIMSPSAIQELVLATAAISQRYAKTKRTAENNPFQLPKFPEMAIPPKELGGGMAMDSNLTSALEFSANGWLAGSILGGLSGEGLQFLGYTYLAQLAQQPEYRIMAETIADDASREWIDFDVTGDEKDQEEARAKDPDGFDERMADPDERRKRIEAAGKTDRVKQLQDDQLRLGVKERFYEQSRNDNFFGRSHLFLDIRTVDTDEIDPKELESDIGDSRNDLSKTKVPRGSFKALRTIEPVWTYPLMYNAINPLRKDWYCPQVWYVMGQQIHGSRLQTFIGHPVPDMLKPAYAFGGISLSQMSKPYVDRWLTTVTSVNDLIKAFSVMIFMTDLAATSQTGGAASLDARMAMFTMFRDNLGVFVGNKNTEDVKNIAAPLSGLHELQAQSQEHMASVNRIPLVKFTGIQPSGLNACLTGETLISTDRGDVPIREVTLKDQVMTRSGFAPLVFSGVTKIATELIEIKTANATIRCTPNHPIWLPSINEFVPAENVRSGDRLLSIGEKSAIQKMRHPWHGAGNGGGRTPTATTSLGMPSPNALSISIEKFGKRIAALFRRDSIFITSTATKKTISRAILKQCTAWLMPNITASSLAFVAEPHQPTQPEGACNAAAIFSSRLRVGKSSAAMRALAPMREQSALQKRDHALSALALCAGKVLSRRVGARNYVRASAQQQARTERRTTAHTIWFTLKNTFGLQSRKSVVESVRRVHANELVYDLSVASDYLPEFFANGILTHNSSEGEIEVYDDTIAAYQARFYDENLRRILNFEMLSLWGEIDPEITHRWNKLRPMTQAEKGQKEKDDADRDQKYVDMGAISPAEVRQRIVNDKELPYTALDPDDMPEPPDQQGMVGPGIHPDGGGEGGGGPEAGTEQEADGGGANDADLPFGATDADGDWREEDHPRAPDGKFGKGSGGSSKSATPPKKTGMPPIPSFLQRSTNGIKTAGLKMPQFGLTPTPWESHQHTSGFKLPPRKPMPKAEGKPDAKDGVVVFEPGKGHDVKELNGVKFESWSPPADWSSVEGQADIAEPPEPELAPGMRFASGAIVREPDGRVWIMRPKGGYGGYDQTFPKGGVDEGLSAQANAIKEVFEETGLKIKITGFQGDHEGDSSVTRFYTAERVGGDPNDAGPESEGVILAPADKLNDHLNRARDRNIATSLISGQEKPKLDPKSLTKIGGKMGSNEGGTFEDKDGNKFYIKRPQSKAHVQNEMAAARLYQLAGVNTLTYREVEGGNHVATELVKLDKNNISKMTPEERKEATKDFAIHAWLGNYDAAGTGGDNQGILNGAVTTLDVGGSLRYRAQGAPKGAGWGPKVKEIETMRGKDPTVHAPDATRLFGKMTDDELKASASRVTSIPDAAIRKAVGDDKELADTLIARKKDLAQRFDIPAMDEANFEEGKHPRGPDGKWTSGGGGGSTAKKTFGSLNAEGKPTAFGGLYKHTGKGAEADYKATVDYYLGQPAKSGTHYRNMLKNLIENAAKMAATDGQIIQLKAHLADAWTKAGNKLLQAGKEQDAVKAFNKVKALGAAHVTPQAAPAKPAEPAKPAKAPEPAPAPPKIDLSPPTAEELKKAAKNVPLQMQYVPGGITDGPLQPAAQAHVDEFNKKWANKGNLTKENLVEKVHDFKKLSAAMAQLQQMSAAQKKTIAEKAAAEAAVKAKAEAEKAVIEAKENAEKNKEIMAGLGITEQQADGVAALAKMLGSETGDIVNSFKSYAAKAASYGYPITGFQAALISNYSNGGYASINKALRSGAWTPAQHVYVAMVNKALMAMPKHKGVVTRNTTLTPEQLALYKSGHIIQENALMSTSTSSVFHGNVQFKVTAIGKRGASIKKLSKHPGEDEVLFAAKTYFKINKIENSSSGKTVIHMEEWEEHL